MPASGHTAFATTHTEDTTTHAGPPAQTSAAVLSTKGAACGRTAKSLLEAGRGLGFRRFKVITAGRRRGLGR